MGNGRWLIPILETYIENRKNLASIVRKEGRLPRQICISCPTDYGRWFCEILTPAEKQAVSNMSSFLEKSGVISVKSYSRNSVEVIARREIVEFSAECQDERFYIHESAYSDDEYDDQVYSYSLEFDDPRFGETGLKDLYSFFSAGMECCPHARSFDEIPPSVENAIVVSKEEGVGSGGSSIPGPIASLAPEERKVRVGRNLFFGCAKCLEELGKRACPDRIQFLEYFYEVRGCQWEQALLMDSFKEVGQTGQFGGQYYNFAIVSPENVIIVFPYSTHYLHDLIEEVKPSAIVIFGKKKEILDLAKYGIDIICIHEDELLYLDSEKEVSGDIESIITQLVTNLCKFADEERGSEHQRYINALAKIGKELGMIPQLEYTSKGSRVDCVWLDRSGSVYGALEVEISGGIKKDVVTTWELAPKVAIILNQTKTNKPIEDLAGYTLLKECPHPLIAINIQTVQ